MSEQLHQSDPRVLNRRTLMDDQRRLAALLRDGMSVLDVGCGTGAITGGIANAVGATGRVLGIDRDESLLHIARKQHKDVANMLFENRDALLLDYKGDFDVVTASRALQWISCPLEVVRRMKDATKNGGYVLVLDYNHLHNTWTPEPPVDFARFYQGFLKWRHHNAWDNLMGEHLPELFESVGLRDICVYDEDEIVKRGDDKFVGAADIWLHVIQTLGPQIVAAGFLDEHERLASEAVYREWTKETLRKQTLQMRAVVGTSS